MDAELNVYIDGDLKPASEATIPVFDHSFLYGDGVFEGIRVYDDLIFKLEEHLDRLYASAKVLDLDIGLSKSELTDAIQQTLRGNPETVTYIRPLVSRGSGPLGIDHTRDIDDSTIVIIPQKRAPKFTMGDDGLNAKVLRTRRTPFEFLESRIKANNYLNNILGKLEVMDTPKVDVGIMLDKDGYVTEACARNVFAVRDEVVQTPQRQNVLNGITRQTVLELADQIGYEIDETRLTPYDFITADEVSLTSTMSEIAWIKRFNDRTIGDGTMGPVTKELLLAYRDLTDDEQQGYVWK
jgi:branched-chain amino acid aminotransferase